MRLCAHVLLVCRSFGFELSSNVVSLLDDLHKKLRSYDRASIVASRSNAASQAQEESGGFSSFFSRFRAPEEPAEPVEEKKVDDRVPKGLYLHGNVGTGLFARLLLLPESLNFLLVLHRKNVSDGLVL